MNNSKGKEEKPFTFKKYFYIAFSLLVLADILTTYHALKNPSIREGNPFLVGIIENSFYLMVFLKISVSLIIMVLYSKINNKYSGIMKQGMKIILFLMIAVILNNLFVMTASALDNTITAPSCLNPSYDPDYPFGLITKNSATNGAIVTANMTAGYISTNDRMNTGINLICAVADPTESGYLDDQTRIWGIDEAGHIFYWDIPDINYSLGFFYPGNGKELYNIANVTANADARITISHNGNVFVMDGDNIMEYVKAADYAPSIFHTLVEGVDFSKGSCAGCASPAYYHHVDDMEFDPAGNLNLIIGTRITNGGNGNLYTDLNRAVFNGAGTLIKTEILIHCKQDNTGSRRIDGYIILDTANYMTEFTYGFHTAANYLNDYPGVYLHHNSSSGVDDIFGGALSGITSINDIKYYGSQLYVISSAANLMKNYLTNYTGYGVPYIGGSNPVTGYVTYISNTVDVPGDNYYNNSEIPISYNLRFIVNNSVFVNQAQLLEWNLRVTDPGEFTSDYQIKKLTCYQGADIWWSNEIWDFIGYPLDWSCESIGTSNYVLDKGEVWIPGIYSVSLNEVYIANFAILDIDTWTVVNQTSNKYNPLIPQPANPITETPDAMDIWASSWFWAAILMFTFLIVGGTTAGSIGAIGGFAIGCVFAYIGELIPLWALFAFVLTEIILVGIMMGTKISGGGGE